MVRSAVVPAAVGVLVFVPLLVSETTKEAEPPPAREATVALALDTKSPTLVHLAANGAAPKTGKPFKLRDKTGLNTATVKAAEAAKCSDTPKRSTAAEGGTAETAWCLQLSDIATGKELSGTIKGAAAGTGESTALAMTVTRRDAFWGAPLAIMVLGLLAGVVATLAPRFKKGVQHLRLARLLSQNRKAAAGTQIEGLDGWVRDRLEEHTAVEDVAGIASGLVHEGPGRAQEARDELAGALEASPLANPDKTQFIPAARAIASEEKLLWSDFITPEGKPKEHPAETWTAALGQMEAHQKELDRQKARIAALPESSRATPEKRLREAEFEFAAIDRADGVARMDEPLDALNEAIRSAGARAAVPRTAGAEHEEPAVRGLVPPKAVEALRGAALPAALSVLAVFLVLLAALVAALAVVPVYFTGYDANPTFDSFKDYFTLGAAALASGAAGSALTVLGYWQLAAPKAA
jgi:hypothetical protein